MMAWTYRKKSINDVLCKIMSKLAKKYCAVPKKWLSIILALLTETFNLNFNTLKILPWKFQKPDFEIALALKPRVHPEGQTYGRVWRPQTIRDARGGHANFFKKKSPKNQKLKISIITWISHQQLIYNSLLRSHKKFLSNWHNTGWVVA